MTAAASPPGPAGPPSAVPGPVLREMRWWDIGPVLALERDLFPHDAWSRGMFWSELAHSRGPGASRRYVVAEDASGLAGYAGLLITGESADVQTIAAARAQWGTGLGARLLADLLRQAAAAGCTEVMLEVRVDNARAQRLYERFGFAPVGVRRGYYQPGSVDALVMRLDLRTAGPADPPPAAPPGAPAPQDPPRRRPSPQHPAHPLPVPQHPAQQGPDSHG